GTKHTHTTAGSSRRAQNTNGRAQRGDAHTHTHTHTHTHAHKTNEETRLAAISVRNGHCEAAYAAVRRQGCAIVSVCAVGHVIARWCGSNFSLGATSMRTPLTCTWTGCVASCDGRSDANCTTMLATSPATSDTGSASASSAAVRSRALRRCTRHASSSVR